MDTKITKRSTGTGRNRFYYLEIEHNNEILENAFDIDDLLSDKGLDYDDLLEEFVENEEQWY